MDVQMRTTPARMAMGMLIVWFFVRQAAETEQERFSPQKTKRPGRDRSQQERKPDRDGLDKAARKLIERVVPALKHIAESHEDWGKWEPPEDRRMHSQFRDRAKTRMMVLARLAVQAVRARKSDEELKEEMGMLLYPLDQLKPLSEVKAEHMARLTAKMEDLKNTKCRIALLETQVQEIEDDIADTKSTLAEIESKIAVELRDILPGAEPNTLGMDTSGTGSKNTAAAQTIATLQEQSRNGTTAYAQLQLQNQQMVYQMVKMQEYMRQYPGGPCPPSPQRLRGTPDAAPGAHPKAAANPGGDGVYRASTGCSSAAATGANGTDGTS
ncbi:unnamed protein product, partial [Prorocentrum cordatum]